MKLNIYYYNYVITILLLLLYIYIFTDINQKVQFQQLRNDPSVIPLNIYQTLKIIFLDENKWKIWYNNKLK